MSISLHLAHLPVGSYEVTVTNAEGTRIFHNKIDLPAQIADTANAKTFPQFKKLPFELRSKIWHYSMQNESRIFYPTDYDHEHEIHQVSFAHKPPATRQVCQEARLISKKRGMSIFGTEQTSLKGLWFDFFSDILYISNKDNVGEYGVEDMVRNVALDWRGYGIDHNWKKLLRHIKNAYPLCERLILVVRYDFELYGDVRFFTILDEEEVTGASGRQKQAWGRMKEEIVKEWRGKMQRITEAQLPTIEAVEVVPERERKTIGESLSPAWSF
ncbi:hypothetical protein ACHAPJ_000308 [Fusarium lateritium]